MHRARELALTRTSLILFCAWTLSGSGLSGCGGSNPASAAAPAEVRANPGAGSGTSAAKPPPEKAAEPKALRITIAELAERRDLWPATVRLTKKVGFSPTEIYDAGREMDLVLITGRDLNLDSGDGLIEVPADRTDVLERASDLIGSLTPDQLALTARLLPQRPELWPVELSVVRPLDFSSGKSIPVGRTVYLRAFQGEQLDLYDRTLQDHFQAAVIETDVLARARERLKLPENDRAPFFLRSVGAALEPSGSAERDASFGKAEYVLVYQARLGCGRCAMFIPHLKEFYERVKPVHPAFEVVFHSADFQAGDSRKLIEKEKLPGRVVAYDKRLEAADLGTQTGELLPLVFLYDRNGKLVQRNQPSGGSPTGEDILAVLEKKLGEGR